jgi:putative colanic acid biosynthesis glycosyltransferase
MSKTPIITVVTVSFNAGVGLEKTIESVLSQNYKSIQYIVVDGGSTDNSIEILDRYRSHLYKCVSEKDDGVYDAMNKGLSLATGNWIIFLNAGDRFSDRDTLERVFCNENYDEADIIYGEYLFQDQKGKVRWGLTGHHKNLKYGSQFCHQSTFIKTKYHSRHPYDKNVRIAADHKFFFEAQSHRVNFRKIDVVVSICESGGISDRYRLKTVLEWWRNTGWDWSCCFQYSGKILKEISVQCAKIVVRWLKVSI